MFQSISEKGADEDQQQRSIDCFSSRLTQSDRFLNHFSLASHGGAVLSICNSCMFFRDRGPEGEWAVLTRICAYQVSRGGDGVGFLEIRAVQGERVLRSKLAAWGVCTRMTPNTSIVARPGL